jgi:hypothetical protein
MIYTHSMIPTGKGIAIGSNFCVLFGENGGNDEGEI